MVELRDWLREMMDERSVSTTQLATLAGVAPNTVTAWRTGRRTPSASSSRRLAEIFETDPGLVLDLAGWSAYERENESPGSSVG